MGIGGVHQGDIVAWTGGSSFSLDDERRGVTRSRIRRAAMEVVAERGFDATVDEIAQAAEVSSRTVFRHYSTHDELIAATVRDMFEACGLPRRVEDFDALIDSLPQLFHDLDSWIDGMAYAFHTRSAQIFGAAFWDIHSPRPRPSPVLREVDALRRDYRLRGTRHVVNVVWQKAGGTGEPPEDLVLAFALYLSAFTTQALSTDFKLTPTQIGALAAHTLKTELRRALQAQNASGIPPVGGTPEGDAR
jgi:AcrR family transcriptional regulator